MAFKCTDHFAQIQNGTVFGPSEIFNGHIGAAFCEREVAVGKTVTTVPN